jgi:Skp family chaperone for outer membrane proteins
MMTKPSSTFIVAGLLLLFLLFFVQVAAQAEQKGQSDMEFIARMNAQATEMYESANKLDAKIAAVDPKSDGKKKRHQIRDNIKAFKERIRDEQRYMDGKDYKKDKSRKDQEKRMQNLQQQLRQIEADMHVLGI